MRTFSGSVPNLLPVVGSPKPDGGADGGSESPGVSFEGLAPEPEGGGEGVGGLTPGGA